MSEYAPMPLAFLALLCAVWSAACFAAARPRDYFVFMHRHFRPPWLPRKPTSVRRDVRLIRIQATATVVILGVIILADPVARMS